MNIQNVMSLEANVNMLFLVIVPFQSNTNLFLTSSIILFAALFLSTDYSRLSTR